MKVTVEQVETVPCPVCKAKPGESCTGSRSSRPGSWWHAQRADAYLEYHLHSLVAEALHTGFRKGTDCPQAHPIWKLIGEMQDGDWKGYIDWVMWALRESGVKVELIDAEA